MPGSPRNASMAAVINSAPITPPATAVPKTAAPEKRRLAAGSEAPGPDSSICGALSSDMSWHTCPFIADEKEYTRTPAMNP